MLWCHGAHTPGVVTAGHSGQSTGWEVWTHKACPISALKVGHGTSEDPRTTTNIVGKSITCQLKSFSDTVNSHLHKMAPNYRSPSSTFTKTISLPTETKSCLPSGKLPTQGHPFLKVVLVLCAQHLSLSNHPPFLLTRHV